MRTATDAATAPTARRWLLRAVLYGVVPALLLVLTLGYHEVVDYVERDPAFCRNCHESQSEYLMWTRSEHRDIVCQRCHHQSRRESLALLRTFVFQGRGGDDRAGRDGDRGHAGRVDSEACARCHVRHDRGWSEIGGSAGHAAHLDTAGVGCMSCHARSIHRFSAASEACIECHGQQTLSLSGMERLHCLACHNFLTAEPTIRPSRAVCTDCHRARGVTEAAYPDDAPMARLACWECHRPHQATGARDVPCTSCHDEMARAGLHDVGGHGECADCHPAHSWLPSTDRCLSCHELLDDAHTGEPCQGCHSFDLVEGDGAEVRP